MQCTSVRHILQICFDFQVPNFKKKNSSQYIFYFDATMAARTLYVILMLTTAKASANSLTCFATLAPANKIICPNGRNQFCVKEFVNSTRRECGSSFEYRNDVWDVKEPAGLCVYRKCASSCTNETVNFEGRDGSMNSRKSVCCSTSLCNSASRHQMQVAVGLTQLILLAALTMK